MIDGVTHTGATRDNLSAAIAKAPFHLKPVLETVRDHGVGMLFVSQGIHAFRIPGPPRKPAIVIFGDDLEQSAGPDGFHLPSVRRAIRACSAFAVISAAPEPAVYAAMAATVTLNRSNVLIVETRLEHEFLWVSLIRKLEPRKHICILTVKGGNA
jgi:hypothetical protein